MGDQLDMPLTLMLFRAKCFTVSLSKGLSEEQYNETLIKFYSYVAQDIEAVWRIKKIEKFTEISMTDLFEGKTPLT